MKQQILELTDNEVFALLQALGKRPFEEVADLIAMERRPAVRCLIRDFPQLNE